MNIPAARRMWWLVQQALREVVQLRFAWIVGLTALVMMAGVTVLREFNFGAEEGRFLRDYAEATLGLWGTVIAIMLNVALVQGGMERGSLVLTFIRGVRRHELLLSRWLAVGVALAWLTLLGYLMRDCSWAGTGMGCRCLNSPGRVDGCFCACHWSRVSRSPPVRPPRACCSRADWRWD